MKRLRIGRRLGEERAECVQPGICVCVDAQVVSDRYLMTVEQAADVHMLHQPRALALLPVLTPPRERPEYRAVLARRFHDVDRF